MKYSNIRGHEPLRTPAGWNDQDRSLVIQLEAILDDLYNRFGRIRRKDLGEELRADLDTYDQAVEELHDLYGLTVTQLKGK